MSVLCIDELVNINNSNNNYSGLYNFFIQVNRFESIRLLLHFHAQVVHKNMQI